MSSKAPTYFDKQAVEWAHQVMEGNNPFTHLTEEKAREIYALAFFLYQEKQYQDASHFFRLLTVCRPSEPKYWKGLGACLQMLRDYEAALNCYISSQILYCKQPDPYLYIHAADCYLALNQKEAAFKALEAARSSAKEKKDRRVLKHVALMRDLWSKSS